MLKNFRSMAGNLGAKLFLGFLVLTFAVWGIGDMVRGGGRNTAVATVGDGAITLAEYQKTLSREMDAVRQALGGRLTPEIARSLQIEQQVLRSLINQRLLALESEALGLKPGDADIVRRIRSNPGFHDARGNFDKDVFAAALRHGGVSEKAYIENIRREIAGGLIMDTLTAALPVSETGLKTLHQAQHERREAAVYVLSPSLVGAVPLPDDAALEAYFSENAAAFTAPEYRTVSYVVLTPEEARAKVAVAEETLLAAYKERIDEFKRPERREAQHLLYADDKEARKAQEMLKSGKPFDEVAKATHILNKGATSLGKVERHNVIESAAEQVFALEAGQFTAPVKSPFGWHVFRVESIEPPSVAPLDEVRGMLEKELKAQGIEQAQQRRANRLEDALAGGATLQEAAAELGLKVQTLGPLTREGKAPDGGPVKGLPEFERFLETAFAAGEKSDSSLVHAGGGVFYLVHVDSVTPERPRTLDEVRGLAASAWQRHERETRLEKLSADIAAGLADKKTRRETIAGHGLKAAYDGPVGRFTDKAGTLALPPALLADIFARPPGEATGAHPTADGGYAVAVAGRKIPSPNPGREDLEQLRAALSRDIENELLGQYLVYLAGKYPVTVNENLLQSAESGL